MVLFTDFACPFSYVAETALARMEEAGEAAATRIAYLLHPPPTPLPAADDGAWRAPLEPLARELGIRFGPAPPPARTAKAHEAAAFAATRGVGPAYRAAVFAARFADGRDVGRVDVLVELAEALGLDPSETKVVLDVDTFAPRIAAEHEASVRAGVEGVPTMVSGEGEGARWWVGARPFAELRAWVLGGE